MDVQLVSESAAETVSKMKSFKQLKTQINELFDRPARWRLMRDKDKYVLYQSEINRKDLIVVFNRGLEEQWEVFFKVDFEIEITGAGDEIEIFSTVLDIMKDFIQRRNPEKLFFTAAKSVVSNSNSRIRLYNRLIRRFARDHGYQLEDASDHEQQVVYTLVRI